MLQHLAAAAGGSQRPQLADLRRNLRRGALPAVARHRSDAGVVPLPAERHACICAQTRREGWCCAAGIGLRGRAECCEAPLTRHKMSWSDQ